MNSIWKTSVQQQFGAAIDMLDNAVRACPDELWDAQLWHKPEEDSRFSVFSEFWYIAYHTLFWLDLYLSGRVEGFVPPAPFTLAELEAGMLPERTYTRDELQSYLEHGRWKCRATLDELTDDQARRPCPFPWGELSFAELLLYNMRHVQEHAAQLSLFLGQNQATSSNWVVKAKEN